jgi:GT2 family glycosyltransferase
MSNIEIVIPTCLSRAKIAPLVCDVEGYAIGVRVHPTCLNASAAKNRNYGLDSLFTDTEYVIMIDDDIRDFYPGWFTDMVRPLRENPDIIFVSARLMAPDGSFGAMMHGSGGKYTGIEEVPEAPTACCAFRKTDLRFNEEYIGSGFEDTEFCRRLKERHSGGKIVVENRCRVTHLNEQKNQHGQYFEHNHKIFAEAFGE